MNGASLKERFVSFMSSGDFVEDIDALVRSGYPNGLQKADYLAWNRSVIIEQKSLDQDVDGKVQAFLGDLVGTHGPLEREGVTLARIIDAVAQLPRGNRFKPKLRAILTQRIDDLLAKADKQTRDTRRFFGLPDAIGIVVMLNEHAALIEPDYFQDKAWNMLRKEKAPGQLRYPENQVVILISEAHRVLTAANIEMIPVETTLSETGLKNPAAEAFASELRQRWATFNEALATDWVGPTRDVTTRDSPPLFGNQPIRE
jgi:hypothetical protein